MRVFSWNIASLNNLGDVLSRLGIDKVDGVLLDLGVSSPQLDDEQRGFSFRFDAPLDMRMDTSRGQTAAEWLATADEGELTEVIRDYGEERFARQIARTIVAARQERRNPHHEATQRHRRAVLYVRANPAKIRRLVPFRLYGFISTANSKNSRACCRSAWIT